MNPINVQTINDTVGILDELAGRIPRAVGIIKGLLEQNREFHDTIHRENDRLRMEIREVQEEKKKLKESEKARSDMLKTQVKGREDGEAINARLRTELNQKQDMVTKLERQKQDAVREKKQAMMTTKIVQEELNNTNEELKKTQIQLDSAKEIEKQIKSNAANQQTLMVEQQRTLAAQTDSAQSKARREDVELGALKLEVAQLKENMNLVRQILTNNPNIDENTRRQVKQALDTSEPKAKMLSNKIKF